MYVAYLNAKGVVILEEMLEVAYCMIHPDAWKSILASTPFAAAISTPLTSDSIYCGKSLLSYHSIVADISDQKIRRSNLSLFLSRGVN